LDLLVSFLSNNPVPSSSTITYIEYNAAERVGLPNELTIDKCQFQTVPIFYRELLITFDLLHMSPD